MDRDKMVRLLTEIYETATERFTLSGKFAYIADLSVQALVELGEPDPRYAHLEPYLKEIRREQAANGGLQL